MRTWLLNRRQQIYVWGFGTSIVAFAFNGILGGMYIGLAVSILLLFYIFMDVEYRKKITLGSPFIYIPIIIICVSIASSGLFQYLINHELQVFVSRVILGAYFFMMYLIARIFGKDLFKPFAWAVVIETLSVIIYNFMKGGLHNGGLASPISYNIAAGLLIFGALVAISKRQWILVSIAFIGVALTGSTEGIIASGILFISMLIRRDLNKKILIPIGIVVIILLLGIYPFKYDKGIYAYQIWKINDTSNYTSLTSSFGNKYANEVDWFFNNRLFLITDAIKHYQVGGTGYVINPTDLGDKPIYNGALVAMQQTGIWSGLAWIFLVAYCLIKTKWKYAWIGVIALSLLDYYMFDDLGLWVFVLAGVSAVSNIQTDSIWKGNNEKSIATT